MSPLPNRRIEASPVSSRTLPTGIPPIGLNADPVVLRHWPQWQFIA
jgi:hypothetical protein